MSPVEKFHILSQVFISFVGGVLLLAIWYNIRQRFNKILEEDENQKRVDKGLLYLSLAMFIWVLSGVWQYGVDLFAISETMANQTGRSLLSTLNNMFLLLAMFYFYYAPAFLYKNEKNVQRIIIAIIALSVFSIFLFNVYGDQANSAGLKVSFIPDLILSGFLSGLMIVSFYRTFLNRGLKIIAWISVGVIGLMFITQLPEVFAQFDNELVVNLVRIIAKTSFIFIFLVLATSWVIQLANTPFADEINIKFMDWSMVKITIPSKGILNQTIDFGSKTTQYKNLLKFAIRRKFAEGNEQCLEVYSGGEIKSQTYLTRIIDNINDILDLDTSQKLERKDLFTFIGHSQYRLRIPPDNISFDKTLLEEFVKDVSPDVYAGMID